MTQKVTEISFDKSITRHEEEQVPHSEEEQGMAPRPVTHIEAHTSAGMPILGEKVTSTHRAG